MQTRRSILKNRQGSGDVITVSSTVSEEGDIRSLRSEQSPPPSNTRAGDGSRFMGQLRSRLREKIPVETDTSNLPSTQQPATDEFNQELYRLRYQNLQLKQGRGSPIRADTSSCPSMETLCSGASGSVKSFPQRKGQSTFLPSTSTTGPPNFSRPLNTLYLLPKPHRLNILETLVRAFPITVPTEAFDNFVDSKGHPDLTGEMKRYFMERKDQHRSEIERHISVFKSERPWEPKWFTNVLWQLLVSTKARPNVYQYMFDIRERVEESDMLQKWWYLSTHVKWIISASSFLMYFLMLCFLIEIYGDEGINLAVPVTLFITIVLNKVLVNINSSLPNGI